MAPIPTGSDIEYPESDGLPMDEPDLHRWWRYRITEWLERRYCGQRVYVSSNLLIYPEEGNPYRRVCPDCFVVLDCEPRFRNTYKLWEEGKAPDVVFEVTSESTRHEDTLRSPPIHEAMGVKECFLYDPTADYLEPPLHGYRCVKGVPTPIRPNKQGALVSRRLGLSLWLEGSDLVMADHRTGERLVTEREFAQAQRQAAERRQLAAEEKLRATLAEIARLRRQLKKRKPLGD